MNRTLRARAILTAGALVALVGCAIDYSNFYTGSDDFLSTGRTLSHFQAIQVDPRSEDTAGPQFVVAEDVNDDGLLDLVSAWNQSQPVQIHLQHQDQLGNVSFETLTLAGNIPVVSVSGLAVTDIDADDRPDIIVQIKSTLLAGASCLSGELAADGMAGLIIVYYAPADTTRTNQALAWEEVPVGASLLSGSGDSTGLPEEGGYTSLTTGDLDMDGDTDILAAWNGACGDSEVLVFRNQGPTQVRDGTWLLEAIPDIFTEVLIKDVMLADVDRDSDLDVVLTRPMAGSMNVRWLRNPTVDIVDDYHITNGEWQVGTIGQIDTGADILELGDVDQDGLVDVVVRSTAGNIVQWFKGPASGPTTQPVRNIPWQVFTLAEFTERTPQSIALGDMNSDGQLELVASAGGGLAWFDSTSALSVYDQWREVMIIDDDSPGNPGPSPSTTDPNVTPQEVAGSTNINSVLVADIDGDGLNDLVVTLDRTGLSGLSNDALVWLRNTR